MAGERAEDTNPPGPGGIVAKLIAAGFVEPVEVGRGARFGYGEAFLPPAHPDNTNAVGRRTMS
jgi:hypothetical protein